MPKIAVIGDRDSVLGYKAIGFDVFEETSFQAASRLLYRLAKEDYDIIFIIEDLYEHMETAVAQFADSRTPAVLSLPGKNGSNGSGMDAIVHAVRKAVGSDIVN